MLIQHSGKIASAIVKYHGTTASGLFLVEKVQIKIKISLRQALKHRGLKQDETLPRVDSARVGASYVTSKIVCAMRYTCYGSVFGIFRRE